MARILNRMRVAASVWALAPRAVRMSWTLHPGIFVGETLCRLASRLLPLAGLWVTKRIVEQVTQRQVEDALALVGVFALVTGIGGAARRVVVSVGNYAGRRFAIYTNTLLQDKVTSFKGIALFEIPRFHDALDNARRSVSLVGTLSMLNTLFAQMCALASVFWLLAGLHPLAPVIVLVTAVPGVVTQYRFALGLWSIRRSGAAEARRMQYFCEVATGDDYAKEVRLFGLGAFLMSAYRDVYGMLYGRLHGMRLRQGLWTVATALLAALGAGGVYAFLAVRAATGAVTVGDLVLYTGLLMNLQQTVYGLSNAFTFSYRGLLKASLLFDFLDMTPADLADGRPKQAARPVTKGIAFEGVMFSYPGTERPALEGISFEIDAGETVALVGANGAGKTTVVKLLTRLYDPTAGRITLDGMDLRDYDVDALRRRFAVVLQDFMRYHLTVRENIGFGQVEAVEDDNRLRAAAERGQAAELIDRLPNGFDTVLGREFPEGVEISGGEWQKLAIARGFMREADVLILDEPTSALDARAEGALYERFAELVRGRSALFISHRLSTVRMADRILVIEGGRLVEAGDHASLMARGGRYAYLFAMQAERYLD